MDPNQQQLLLGHGGGGEETKTYIDDVFSTQLYTGTQTVRTLNSGIDLAGEGGMVWFKNRQQGWSNRIWDTVRGQSKFLYTANVDAQLTDSAPGQNDNMLASFDSNGVTIGKDQSYGGTNYSSNFVNWQFRKAKGFFDVVTYSGTGTGSGQDIPHNLGSIPGCIMIKRLNASSNWAVYHRGYNQGVDPWHYRAFLNLPTAAGNNNWFNDTAPTSTHFSVGGAHNETDGSGGEYIAYLFAGGASTTATSLDFAGRGGNHDDELTPPSPLIPSGRDSNKFCMETWIKVDNTSYGGNMIYGQYVSGDSGRMFVHVENSSQPYNLRFFVGGSDFVNVSNSINADQWYHIAWSYDGTNHRVFINGELKATVAGSSLAGDIVQSTPRIGGIAESGYCFNGKISNFRVVHGQAVYTSSFDPPLDPLTITSQGVTGTNCKVLCCNNTNILNNDGSLGALTNPDNGLITALTDSPFDDPEGNKFGENEDQNLIKCGYFKGNGSTQDIDVGFEPQWVMIKNVDWDSGYWSIMDSMRGAANRPGSNDQKGLFANDNQQEAGGNYVGMYSRGFKLLGGESSTNRNNDYHVYMAIRRPDGLVGKPPSAANEVYTQVYGTSNNDIPAFNSGFVTDFTFFKQPGSGSSWYTQERLHGVGYMVNSSGGAEADSGNNTWDFMDGYYKATGDWSSSMNWMWKRGAGFDVVDWNGNGNVRHIPHSLGQAPEFVIVKRRSTNEDWTCYHKGLNGGTNPSHYYIQLNSNSGEAQYDNYEPGNPGAYNMWNREDPTSSHIAIGEHGRVNTTGQTYMALLFASANDADGNPISKVGYYGGNDTSQTISTGFQPRVVIIKIVNPGHNGDWILLDTTRGWASGNDAYLRLNSNDSQLNNVLDIGAPTSGGFTVVGGSRGWNEASKNYIYYAHA